MKPGEGARRLGIWAAAGIVVLAALYIATGVAWLVQGGEAAARHPFSPTDPHLAILEWLLVLVAPFMVAFAAAVHWYAPRDRQIFSLTALSFMIPAAAITCCVHFVRLVVARHLDPDAAAHLAAVLSFNWPSVVFALDLLAWDLLAGIAMLSTAPVFPGGGLNRSIRVSLLLGGALCLAGFLGPATGDLRLQLPAIAGYAIVYPVSCLLIGVCFKKLGRKDRHAR